jgi:hypothetical protein
MKPRRLKRMIRRSPMNDDRNDDQERSKNGKPPAREARKPLSREDHRALRLPTGVVSATFTAWRAASMAKTYEEIERAAKAKNGAAREMIDLERTLHEANDLPDTLAEDQAERDHARKLAAHRRRMELAEAGYDEQIIEEKKQKQLERARNSKLHARRLREITEQVKDIRIETIRQQYEAGKCDSVVEWLTALGAALKAAEVEGEERSEQGGDIYEQIAALDEDIRNAVERGENTEVIRYLVTQKYELEQQLSRDA